MRTRPTIKKTMPVAEPLSPPTPAISSDRASGPSSARQRPESKPGPGAPAGSQAVLTEVAGGPLDVLRDIDNYFGYPTSRCVSRLR
jgi:hypothetical protein